MAAQTVWDSLLALFILLVFFLIIYTSMKKQTISEFFNDLRHIGGKKDEPPRIERYYR